MSENHLYQRDSADDHFTDEQIIVDGTPVQLRSLSLLSGKLVVISKDKGIFVRENQSWIRLWQGNGLSADEVFDIAEEANGIWWIATSKGLSRWDGSGFQVFAPFSNPPAVHAVALNQGKVYVGNNSIQTPIRVFDGSAWSSLPYNEVDLFGNVTRDILFEPDGKLYSISGSVHSPVIGVANFITAFDGNSWSAVTGQGLVNIMVDQTDEHIFALSDNLLMRIADARLDTLRYLNCSSFSGNLFRCTSGNRAFTSVESFSADYLVQINLASSQAPAQLLNDQAYIVASASGQLFNNPAEHDDELRKGSFGLLSQPQASLADLAGVWIGGKTNDGWSVSVTDNEGLHHDFASGPVAPQYDMDYLRKYDRVWVVDRDEIKAHELNFAKPNYSAPEAILNWPANRSGTHGAAVDLAPFSDRNNNGVYEPEFGDVPLIRGDRALYFIFNDHRSLRDYNYGAESFGVEVHGMIYTYRNQNSLLDSVFFLNYRVVNRSEVTIDSLLMSFSMHHRIGSIYDDALGSDSILGMSYYYNLDNIDDSTSGFGPAPPALGLVQLNNPLRGFIVHDPPLSFSMSNRRYPDSLPLYLQYLKAKWPNGNRIRVENPDGILGLNNGDGFIQSDAGQASNFVFNDAYNWFQSPYDNRLWVGINLLSVPQSLHPGESFCVDLALVPKRAENRGAGTEHLQSLYMVKDAIERLKLLNLDNTACLMNEMSLVYSENIGVYPNPTTGMLYLSIPETGFAEELILYDTNGRVVKREYGVWRMDISNLSAGIYFLSVRSRAGVEVLKVLKR